MNSCAIDISEQSIKYGELGITSSGLYLNKYGKEIIPSGVVVSGKIEKEDELIQVLKKIKEKENLHYIRVSLPEEQMYLFTLSLPKTDDENIREMILLQIEEHIPLKAPDCIFDYDIISTYDQNILIEVVAIAEATLTSYLSVFKQVGLVPLSFELEAQAIARAVIPTGDINPVMIVDFGNTKTGISISNNGRVFLTTTLSIGGIDLTNMIAKNFSLSFEDAEKMKHEYGIDQVSKAEDIFPAILNGISVLRDELNKQYMYWETHNNNSAQNKINHIILCGGDANLAGLSEYLELSMKIKVENANVWVNILDKNKEIPEMSFEDSLGYATVLGLALGGYIYNSQSVINILPQKEKRKIVQSYWLRYLTILLNLVSLIGITASLLLFPSYSMSGIKEGIIENSLEVFNKDNPDLENTNIDEIISNINSKLEILDKSSQTYKISDKVFGEILATRTEGIKFSQILFSRKNIEKKEVPMLEIYGSAENRDSLRNFKIALDKNTNFLKVDLPVSNFLEKSDLTFIISITLKE
jgi:type IV pilus assembly protein PilM